MSKKSHVSLEIRSAKERQALRYAVQYSILCCHYKEFRHYCYCGSLWKAFLSLYNNSVNIGQMDFLYTIV